MARVGRPSNAAARRRQVLAVAAEIFSRRGYRATTMNDIAAAAGLSKPTLYHYFRNKEEMLVRLYEDVLDQSVDEAQAIADEVDEPAAALRALIKQRVVATCTNRAMFKVFFEEEEELPPEMGAVLLRRRRDYENIFKGVLARTGHAEQSTVVFNSTLFINTCLGAANWTYKWYDPEGPLSPEEVGDQIASFVLAHLTAAAGAGESISLLPAPAAPGG